MNHTPEHDALLHQLLRQTEHPGDLEPASHVDDETLALFVEGGLPPAERDAVIAHLANCPDCRQAAATLLSVESERVPGPAPQTVISPPQINAAQRKLATSRFSAVAISIAAALLVVAGLWFGPWQNDGLADRRVYQNAELLLAKSDFEGARSILEAARRQGVRSDQLLSLESQAVRHLPGTLALASSGRLTDFGYDVDGTVARGAVAQIGLKEAGPLLNQAQTQELELLLNRGHWALASGEPAIAAKDFERATEIAPEQIWGWLGLGLVRFEEQDNKAAETAFRRCLEIDSKNVNARINLAMTLQEQDRLDEARSLWQSLKQENLSTRDRQLVERALNALK